MIPTKLHGWVGVLGALALAGCSSAPPSPDWALEAQSASERAVKAYLQGQRRVAALEWRKAFDAVSATGQPSAMAQMALLQCAAQTAALEFSECATYQTYATGALPAQHAYARYLQVQYGAGDVALLPPGQQQVAAQLLGRTVMLALPQAEPLSQLTAAGVALRAGGIAPEAVDQAVEVAAQQGWRRAAIAWVLVAQRLAQAAGDRSKVEAMELRLQVLQSTEAALDPVKK
jgi:hypothetical protein